MLPAVRAGAAKAGRSLDKFQVCMKPLVAAAATEAELVPKVRDVRARISFYASTPQYRAAFAHHGLGDLADELKLLSRAQRWEEMPQQDQRRGAAHLRHGRHLRPDRAEAHRRATARWSRIASSRSRSRTRPTRNGCARSPRRSRPTDVSPPVQPVASDEKLPKSVDVVVIGAGIAGCTAAYELAKRDFSVALLDKGRVGGEQSSRNWGWVRQQHRDLRELPLAMKSLEIWGTLNEEIGAETGFRRTGLVYVTTRPADFAQWEAWTLEGARVPDAQPRALAGRGQGDDAGQRAATGSAACIRRPTAAPSRRSPAPAIAEAARRLGATIHQDCAARGLETEAGKVSGVITEKGVIRTQAVLLAGGAWSGLFCRRHGLRLPQAGVKSTSFSTEAAPEVAKGGLSMPDVTIRRRLDGGYTVGPGRPRPGRAVAAGPDVRPRLLADLQEAALGPQLLDRPLVLRRAGAAGALVVRQAVAVRAPSHARSRRRPEAGAARPDAARRALSRRSRVSRSRTCGAG